MLQGWHRGEKAIQRKLQYDGAMAHGYTWIEGEMPEQHRTFHTTRLPFIPVTTLDSSGRPWSCILAGPSGKPGFVSSPNWDRLDMNVRVWEGDPFKENVESFRDGKMLMAGIGIEFSTRRRNKFAGHVFELRQIGDTYQLKMVVNQAIGNCPKYINVRELGPHPDTKPFVAYNKTWLLPSERLPDELIAFVHAADTVFIGTSYKALKEDEAQFPSHVGQNQRAGKPGYMRVMPSDGRTVVLPDYSGNRLLTSLGNIEATPVASLSYVDFVTGDILYLTGDACTLVGSEAQAVMPRQNVVTLVTVTGYILVKDALPVRQRPGTGVERSPYSPPVRLLAEETVSSSSYLDDQIIVTLSSIELHSNELATFTWDTCKPIHILPGQTAILDMTDLVGARQYAHMAAYNPTSVNDDRIRTWTVSSVHLSPEGTKTFSLTMRQKPGGVATGALFGIARRLAELRPELMKDCRPLNLELKLVGIAGDFILPKSISLGEDMKKMRVSMVWFAGGIGLTPFLSMLKAITGTDSTDDIQWDIVLALSTREPEVLMSLINAALRGDGAPDLRLVVDVFSANSVPASVRACSTDTLDAYLVPHNGRISQAYLTGLGGLETRTAYLCGPEPFERSVLEMLAQNGYSKPVIRESFEY